MAFILIVLASQLFRLMKKGYTEMKASTNHGYKPPGTPFFFSGLIAGTAISILALVFTYQGIGELLNPRYYAIKTVIEAVQPSRH